MVRHTGLDDEQLSAAAHGNLDPHELVIGLKAAGIEGSVSPNGGNGLADALAAELSDHAREELAQREHRRLLAAAGQPCYELPLITDRMDLAGLYRLAAALRDQGAA
jgi:hypothetical protein